MKKAFLFIIIFSQAFLSCNDFIFKKKEVRMDNKGKEIFLNENGDTVVFNYRENGTILSKVTIKGRYKNGPAFNYYDDGTVQHEFNYKDGVKHGVARFFYESGKLYRETFYVNGQQVATTTDPSYTGGDVGLIAGTFDIPSTEITYDNFIVKKP